MNDPITGVWLENITCPTCRHRHPAIWTCKIARAMRDANREQAQAREAAGAGPAQVSDELRALRETQEALNVTQCPWCGAWGADYDESARPSAYCHHEYALRPWRQFWPLDSISQ